MSVPEAGVYAVLVLIGVPVGYYLVHVAWRAIGAWQIRRAGPRPLRATAHRLWRDPDPRERLDPHHGPGGIEIAPSPPFQFVEEHASGSQPCVSVVDARGRRWRVKWGDEVRSENFAVRFAWACGYYTEVTYFIPSGTIHGAGALTRARECVDPASGTFCDARFELDDPAVTKMFEEHSWSWTQNPFLDSRELSGLKIVVMLLSNWDTKDRRDVARGSNTAIFEHQVSPRRREARYLLTDWGGSMGRWGSNMATRGRWDIDGFEAQTPGFVTGVRDGCVTFGYSGQHTAEIGGRIPIDHVRWFYPHLARITDEYLHAALRASGADDDEARRFTRALRDRIRQIGETVAAGYSTDRDVTGSTDDARRAGR